MYLCLHMHKIYSLVAQRLKRLPLMQETWVLSLGREDPLEKEMAPHSSTLAWKIYGRSSVVGYSLWGLKVSNTTEQLSLSRIDNGAPASTRAFEVFPPVVILISPNALRKRRRRRRRRKAL